MIRRLGTGGTIGAALLAIVLASSLAAPLLTSSNPDGTSVSGGAAGAVESRFRGPSMEHPLGTDSLGRDVLAGVLYGARISLFIGVVSRLGAVVIGTLIGSAAGYFGGWTDSVLNRFTEIVLSFPSLLLAIGIGTALGPSPWTVFIAIVAVNWTDVAVLTRAMVQSLMERDFVTAARIQGAGAVRIIFSHILPNIYGALAVAFTFGVANAVMVEASLSFLGIGSAGGGGILHELLGLGSSMVPSWGRAIFMAEYHLSTAPWAVLGPGMALAMTILGWNLLGDAMRDVLDVRGEKA